MTVNKRAREKVCTIYERRRIPTVVVGEASSSLEGTRHFGVMHFQMKVGASITDDCYVREEESRQTDSQPVMNNNNNLI